MGYGQTATPAEWTWFPMAFNLDYSGAAGETPDSFREPVNQFLTRHEATFPNVISRDAAGTSRSALHLLGSADGVRWRSAAARPVLAPDEGWRRSHVYACDARLRETESRWHLYYNARDGWHKARGRERIGRLVAPA